MHPVASLLGLSASAPGGLRYLSVCSGIEAATTAWRGLGWTPAAFSEIEPFPSAVLAHHWPHVPNLGDMTRWRDWPEELLASCDLIVGGTPCQAFSVAGLRKSLDDERGNLTLTYVHIIDHIDRLRSERGLPPVIVVWENVPGVLSTKDNAFGCFLGTLAGEDEALVPPGKRWANAGLVVGPQRQIGYRVLDAQYFGVAQRRRRVFLVASARDGFCPAEILLEPEGVRRDSPPSREAGQDTTGSTGDGVAGGGWKRVSFAADCEGYDEETGELGDICSICGLDYGNGCECPGPTQDGYEYREDRDGVLWAREEGSPEIPCFWNGEQVTQTLDAVLAKGQTMPEKNRFPAVLVPEGAFADRVHGENSTAMTGNGKANVADPVEVARCLDSCGGYANGQGGNVVAFSCKDHGADASHVAPTLRSMGHDGSHANAGGQVAVAFIERGRKDGRNLEIQQELAHSQMARNGGGATDRFQIMTPAMQVRRLTTVECARLQGFPDHHTRISWRGKPAEDCPDGPQYKAYGNSMAVPCMGWIGRRIAKHLQG